MSASEEEETIVENIEFFIDESKSTSNSKFVIRRRTLRHCGEKEQNEWSEIFEETFTIPLHKFNLSLILSHSKIENIEETVVVSRTIYRKKVEGTKTNEEKIELGAETIRDQESILPMINFNEIRNIRIVEKRRQIRLRKVSAIKELLLISIQTNFVRRGKAEQLSLMMCPRILKVFLIWNRSRLGRI
jgi:hypothetical protein